MIISKTIDITTPILPPEVDFIENEIKNQTKGEIIRWAIVDIKDNILKVSVSYQIIDSPYMQ